jgi:anti-anti-sigma factor
MNKGKILFSLKSNVCFVKLIGELRYNLSQGFDSLVRRELKNNQTTHFILDLKEAEYLDSTNLGIIGMIAAGLKNKSAEKPVIVGPHKDILTIFRSMSFDTLFEISDTWKSEKLNYQDTSTIDSKKRDPREMILESHKTLAGMSKHNKEKFDPVIETILKNKKR